MFYGECTNCSQSKKLLGWNGRGTAFQCAACHDSTDLDDEYPLLAMSSSKFDGAARAQRGNMKRREIVRFLCDHQGSRDSLQEPTISTICALIAAQRMPVACFGGASIASDPCGELFHGVGDTPASAGFDRRLSRRAYGVQTSVALQAPLYGERAMSS